MTWHIFGGTTMRVPSNLTASILSRTCHTFSFFYSASNVLPPAIGAPSPCLDLQSLILAIVCCHFHGHLPFSPSKFVINHADKMRGHFGIMGRATQILPATSHSRDPRDVSKSLEGTELVAKIYWAEASRVGEGEIIEKARQIVKHNDSVNGHIPDLIYSHDFDDYSTKGIRTALGIVSEGHRPLRVMLFR
jgi:hypothetical protein